MRASSSGVSGSPPTEKEGRKKKALSSPLTKLESKQHKKEAAWCEHLPSCPTAGRRRRRRRPVRVLPPVSLAAAKMRFAKTGESPTYFLGSPFPNAMNNLYENMRQV